MVTKLLMSHHRGVVTEGLGWIPMIQWAQKDSSTWVCASTNSFGTPWWKHVETTFGKPRFGRSYIKRPAVDWTCVSTLRIAWQRCGDKNQWRLLPFCLWKRYSSSGPSVDKEYESNPPAHINFRSDFQKISLRWFTVPKFGFDQQEVLTNKTRVRL